MDDVSLTLLLEGIIKLPKECEWVEFKQNYHSVEEIGERLSALSNGACLCNQAFGYLIYGVKDESHIIEGTDFDFHKVKKGNEEIEHWLLQRLSPRIDYKIYQFNYKGKKVVLLEIPSAANEPVSFMYEPYIRVGSITRRLRDFPEKARKIWKKEPLLTFEREVALDRLSADEVIRLLDTQAYFDTFGLPYPTNRTAVLEKFTSERLIINVSGKISITNLGAILFAKNLNDFDKLKRKAPRVIIYDGKNKIYTLKDSTGIKGYALGFEGLVSYINDQLPSNEAIKSAIRETVRVYPQLAIRELVANALIHQDFRITGTGPLIEIYSDRIEITNPGLPLITTIRFIDEYQSRNEDLASFMRRLGICEEKGSGVDKVIALSETFQLPAPDFQTLEKHTKAIMYTPKTLNEMDKKDRIRACYQHACLKHVSNDKMTNQSLREGFQIESKNAAIASRIIKETIEEGLVKDEDESSTSRKYARYIPFWA